jgi:hypothetical protein
VAKNWASKSITLSIFKHSLELGLKADLITFEKEVLRPPATDNAGAPSEILYQEMINRLQEAHPNHYEASHINWRHWATYILNQPRPQHTNLVQGPPPPHLSRAFVPSNVSLVQQNDQLMRERTTQAMRVEQLRLSSTINNQFMADLQNELKAASDAMGIQLETLQTFKTNITLRRAALDGLLQRVKDHIFLTGRYTASLEAIDSPNRNHPDILDLLIGMEPQLDVDHDPTLLT